MKNIFVKLIVVIIPFLSFSQINLSPELKEKQWIKQDFLENKNIGFEENKGQIVGHDGSRVRYFLGSKDLQFFLMDHAIAYQFEKIHFPEGYSHPNKFSDAEFKNRMEKLSNEIQVETFRIDVELVGANKQVQITTEGKSNDYKMYYNKNALNVHTYNKITYHNVYPNINWVIYINGNQVKYDFVVLPNGNPEMIKLKVKFADSIKLNEEGDLNLISKMGIVTEKKPFSFQENTIVGSKFKLENNTISFDLENYDHSKTLIIDPEILWSSYYGGPSYDYGYDCSIDNLGNVYLSGETNSNLAIASGGHQNSYVGAADAFLVKFNNQGTRLWATYFGGSESDTGNACTTDSDGNIYLAGETLSASGISFNGHQNNYGSNRDGFLAKFNPSGVLLWSTYYGGSNVDAIYDCATDLDNNVYIVGTASSSNAISSNGFLNIHGGFADAFLVKFNSSGIRQWGTYFYGGLTPAFQASSENGFSCATDQLGNVYMAGKTNSNSGIAYQGHQNSCGGQFDAFLVKFNSSGSRIWSTFYGGAFADVGFSCDVDSDGNVYLAGETGSNNNIAFQGHQNEYTQNTDAFLVKFDENGVRIWGTYFGTLGNDPIYHCTVDNENNIYMVGTTSTFSGFGIGNGGFQNEKGVSDDAAVIKFNSIGQLQWSSYHDLGAQNFGMGCAAGNNILYIVGYTGNSPYNQTLNGFQPNYGGGTYDAYITKIETTNFSCETIFSIDNISSCQPIVWIDGNTYSESNNTATFQLEGAAQNGCDSIVTLNFTLHSAAQSVDVIQSCSPLTWIDGNLYLESNYTATHNLVGAAQNGCDSIVTLNFTLLPHSIGVDNITTCLPIYWIDGNIYTENNNSATYLLEGAAQNGCDSLVTLNLTFVSCTQLQPSSCNSINVDMDDVIGAVAVPNQTNYRFRIFGDNLGGLGWNGYAFILDRPVRNFRFAHVPGAMWGATYTVEVAVGDGLGNYGPYGAACDVTLASLPPTTQLQNSQCGISDVSQSTFLFANHVSNTVGYRFRIIGANNGAQGWSGNTYILDRPSRDFRFSMVPGVIWGETYSVEVAALSLDNVTYGDYGAACNVTLQGIPTTALQSSQCGITNVTQNTALFANAVSGAAGYRFKVVGANNGATGWVVDTYILDRPVRNFKFNMIPGVLQGEEYEVQVAVMDADGNYGTYGSVCNVELEGAPDLVINDDNILFNDKSLTEIAFGASASHNPFTTDFGIQVLNANDSEVIDVVIYDMSGKLIESSSVNPMDIEGARFGKNLAIGMYMIQVTQGANQVVIRQVKQ